MSTPVASVITGCGFKLREPYKFAFSSIYLGTANGSMTRLELQRTLLAGKNVHVITEPAQQSTAQVVFEVLDDARVKKVVGIGKGGLVREFTLTLRFKFRLSTEQGKILLDDADVSLDRDVSFNDSAVLAKEAEEGLIYRDMQNEVVQQILRRLAAVKSL